MGIYASLINEDYEYKEYLVRLLHIQGTHSGERIGDGLFNLFSKHLNLARSLGPGTADNASNNVTAAERIAVLMKSEYSYEYPAENLMGCVCHIANPAALAYLEGESTLDATEYAYAQENIPEIRVMGQSAFWNPQLAEDEDGVDGAEGEGPEDLLDLGDTGVDDREDEDLLDIDDDEEMLDLPTGNSPVDLVHQLGVFVHASPKRRAAFEKVRADRNPDTPKGLLPLKDVATRWNSKEAAISRVLRLRETVEYFTTRAKSDNCPRFNKKVFDALLRIQPTLQIFLQLTLDYSEVGANAYRVLPDLVNAIDQITEIHDHPSVSTARKRSAEAACAKLSKYLKRFLHNDWLCAAFALDPAVRQDGLWSLMEAYDLEDRYQDVLDWIESGFLAYADTENTRESEVEVVRKEKNRQRANKFASERFKAGHQEITHDMDDPWACYNSTMTRFAMKENDTVLGYWKRMSKERELWPLARFSKDVLGLAASSASVERLFSHAGHSTLTSRAELYLPAFFGNLRSEWRTQCKFAKAEEDKTFDALSQLFNTHALQLTRNKEQDRVTVLKGHSSTRFPKAKVGDGPKHQPATDRYMVKPEAKPGTETTTEEIMALFGKDSLVGTVTRVLDPYEEHGAVLAALRHRHQGKILWIIDSGATDHVCSDREAFCLIRACPTPTHYRTPGNDVVSEEEGVVAMQLPESKKPVLSDVTYLRSAPANLPSLGTLQQRGWIFGLANCFTQLGPCRIPMYNVGPKGKQQKGKLHVICLRLLLPTADASEPPMRSLFVIAQEKDTLLVWHRRLAHVGVSTIKEWARQGRLQILTSTGPEVKMED
ncbi:hypothetical protein QFC22_006424 [Naganishia vaughanmartiniae]|uniref:Uncharacterized protein n=1 Tax=Naganishia vaughanmartiniae TaxID=1424756 RepID=A0ACC2WKQ1_9TREE|nr:hypothetical protein QFC22_006424 [Naganishia vaughanmartiniae]